MIEDAEEKMTVIQHQRTTIADIFLELKLGRDVRIIDVACGIGIVAEDISKHGYLNVDGLDPSRGYLEVANSKKIYKVQNIIDVVIRRKQQLNV